MDISKEYIVVNEYGKYAKFSEAGIFIEWSYEKCSTPHKWAAEAVHLVNPECKVKTIEIKNC